MAVIVVPEPSDTLPDTTDWQEALSKMSKISRGLGLMICRLTNMTNSNEPQVQAGTRFEMNAVVYEVSSDESITGWSGISVGSMAYVYAVPGATETDPCTFVYSSTAPAFDVAKGGHYNGANRALFRLYKTSASLYDFKQELDVIDLTPCLTADPVAPRIGQRWIRVDLL
jgi:hypothetical protein